MPTMVSVSNSNEAAQSQNCDRLLQGRLTLQPRRFDESDLAHRLNEGEISHPGAPAELGRVLVEKCQVGVEVDVPVEVHRADFRA